VTAGTYAELLELQATDRVNASAVALPELAISDVLAAADA
jgi:hypothetical protein